MASAPMGRPSSVIRRRLPSRSSSTVRVFSPCSPGLPMRTSSVIVSRPPGSVFGVLLAPGVECVIDGKAVGQAPLVAQFEQGKALGNGLQPRRFRRGVLFTADVGPVDNLRQVQERGLFQPKFAD